MKKTLTMILLVALCGSTSGYPVKSAIGGDGVEYERVAEEAILNTDYLRYGGSKINSQQSTDVWVGYGTDFDAGAKIVFDVTVEDWYTATNTMFSYCSGVGYMWCTLSPAEALAPGRYLIGWTNQKSVNVKYNVAINGDPSFRQYSTYWQLYNSTYELVFGNRYSQAGWTFSGKWHNIKLYDKWGKLRHWWIPDSAGVFYDTITETYTTNTGWGRWTYGDDAVEEEL